MLFHKDDGTDAFGFPINSRKGFYLSSKPDEVYTREELKEKFRKGDFNKDQLKELRSSDETDKLAEVIVELYKILDEDSDTVKMEKKVHFIHFKSLGYSSEDATKLAAEAAKTSVDEALAKYGKEELIYVSGEDQWNDEKSLRKALAKMSEDGIKDVQSDLNIVLIKGGKEIDRKPVYVVVDTSITGGGGSYSSATGGAAAGSSMAEIERESNKLGDAIMEKVGKTGEVKWWALYQVKKISDKKRVPLTPRQAKEKIDRSDELSEEDFAYVPIEWIKKGGEWKPVPDFDSTDDRKEFKL